MTIVPFLVKNLIVETVLPPTKLKNVNPYIFATQCGRGLTFQPMNSVRSNNLNLKYPSFTPVGGW